MRRSQNKEEQKRILMDLEVVMKCHGCPFIVNCFGSLISRVCPTAACACSLFAMENSCVLPRCDNFRTCGIWYGLVNSRK